MRKLLALLALVVAGTVSASSAWSRPAAASAPPDGRPAQAIYQADCAVCHGADGRGTKRGPTLARVGRASVDYYVSTGRMPLVGVGRTDLAGRPLEPMPQRLAGDPDIEPQRHQAAYDRATIDRLVSYVGDLVADGGPGIPAVGHGDVAQGGELFRLQCAACHTSTGDGGALLRREAPSLHDADERETAEAIRVGPGQMPAFGEAAMTGAQVASVVAYVHYLDHPRDRGGRALLHLGPVAEGGLALVAVFVMLLFARWIGERG